VRRRRLSPEQREHRIERTLELGACGSPSSIRATRLVALCGAGFSPGARAG